jgi:uncharacterized protein YndB with AHSA1/START domain
VVWVRAVKVILWAVFLLSVAGLRAETPEVSGDVTRTLAGEAIIHLSFLTTQSPEKLWRALSVPDELTHWAAPAVKVQLRVGGAYEYFSNPQRPIGRRGMEGTRILCYVPGKMLCHSGPLPDTWVIWSIEPAGDQQVVHYYAVGTSADWNETCAARTAPAQELVERLAKYVQP